MVPSEAVTSPSPGCTVHYTVHSTLCTLAQHPSSKTRPILTSSPGLRPAQTLGEMVARMRGWGGWRLPAPAQTSWPQNWPQSRSNQRPDFSCNKVVTRSFVQGWPGHRVSGRSQASLSLNLGSNSDHSWQKPTSEAGRTTDRRSGDRAHRRRVSYSSYYVISLCKNGKELCMHFMQRCVGV